MRVVFRVDASNKIGTGHVMRCRSLAAMLQKEGAQIHFITRAHDGHLADILVQDGFSVTLLPKSVCGQVKGDNYAAWLGASQKEDAEQTIIALREFKCDWLIVDHYGLDHLWEVALRPHTQKLMVVDDLANRTHDCDLLLDQNYREEGNQSCYKAYVPVHCQLLLGPKYALLRPEYAQYRKTMKRKSVVKRILVFMGGADANNATGKVLDALNAKQLAHLEVDVVLGPNFTHKTEVVKKASLRPYTNIHEPRPHLADLMSDADLAIGAGGATTWERLCLSLPSLVLSIANNQVSACKALASLGLIKYLGDAANVDASIIEQGLLDMVSNFSVLQEKANQGLVDGRGLSRVLEILIPSAVEDLAVRSATEVDASTFFSRVSQEYDASKAINTKPLDFATYAMYFNKQLDNENRQLYILEARGLPIGEIGFEINDLEARVDYYLDDMVAERNWSSRILKLGIEALYKNQVKTVKQLESRTANTPFVYIDSEKKLVSSVGELRFSIVIITDRDSWLNVWLPEMMEQWLNEGHRVLWTHQLENLQSADFCFFLSFSKIVPNGIRALFKNNLVVHESDLPKGKGWSPLTWQILNGENKIPVTLIEAEESVDSGNIYDQEWINFDGSELINELRVKQARATINLCVNFVKEYPSILKCSTKQAGAESFYQKRGPENSVLDVNRSIADQFNLLRTVDNQKYPAFFEHLGYHYEIQIKKVAKKRGKAVG